MTWQVKNAQATAVRRRQAGDQSGRQRRRLGGAARDAAGGATSAPNLSRTMAAAIAPKPRWESHNGDSGMVNRSGSTSRQGRALVSNIQRQGSVPPSLSAKPTK